MRKEEKRARQGLKDGEERKKEVEGWRGCDGERLKQAESSQFHGGVSRTLVGGGVGNRPAIGTR